MTSAWVGERIRLRGAEPGDWEPLLSFEEDSEAARNSYALEPPRSAVRAKKWVADLAEREPDPDEFELVIADRRGNAAVGTIQTHQIERVSGRFHYGIVIGAPHRRKGYASEAVLLVLRYMFRERRFQKAEATVFGFNEPSLELHRRLGFVEEGRRRRARFASGRFEDEVLFGMLAEEFAERHG